MSGLDIKDKGVSRRSFLALGAAAGGAFSMATLFGANASEAEAKTFETLDEAVEIDMDVYERMDENRTAFNFKYCYGDGSFPSFPGSQPVKPEFMGIIGATEGDNQQLIDIFEGKPFEKSYEKGDPGYTPVDYAFFLGGGTTYGPLHALPAVPLVAGPGSKFVAKERYEFESLHAASYAIKKVAKVYGADIVGIAPYDERFTYKTECKAPDFYKPVDLPFTPKSCIVIGCEMDYEAIKTAGGMSLEGGVFSAYSHCIETIAKVSNFLRLLGYYTRHSVNDLGPTGPHAISAGLGEGGRMSILVTKEFGPRVRLAKCYTDLECEYDKPKFFGVTEFCEVCQVCTDNCPSGALTNKSINDPENTAANKCSQPGVKKYYCDAQTCYVQWQIMDNGCGICITVCPYNKPQTWNHDLVKAVTLVPGLNRLARYFDHFFGFGYLATKEELSDFWKRTI